MEPVRPDAMAGVPDAVVPDALPTTADAPMADAAPAVDAPLPDAPAPDANSCPAAGNGEPDDTCPGQPIGPAKQGLPVTVDSEVIFPAGDVDVFALPVVLQVEPHCIGPSVNYAVSIELSSDAAVTLARFGSDRECVGATEAAGTFLCLPFSVPCKTPPPPNPTFYFAVVAAGPVSCQPYTLLARLCSAASPCDHCLVP
jgi:hypothetical protein